MVASQAAVSERREAEWGASRRPINPGTHSSNVTHLETINTENVQEMSKPIPLGHFLTGPPRPQRTRDKNHVDYWKQRLFRNSYTRDGRYVELLIVTAGVAEPGNLRSHHARGEVLICCSTKGEQYLSFTPRALKLFRVATPAVST